MQLDLFDEIVPEKSKATVGLYKIDIVLEKKNKTSNWLKLEGEPQAVPEAVSQPETADKSATTATPAVVVEEKRPFYASSSKV